MAMWRRLQPHPGLGLPPGVMSLDLDPVVGAGRMRCSGHACLQLAELPELPMSLVYKDLGLCGQGSWHSVPAGWVADDSANANPEFGEGCSSHFRLSPLILSQRS